MSVTDLPNGRDLGGRRTAQGAMLRTGIVFRSAAPGDSRSRGALTALGITTVFDLRTEPERHQRPNELPDGTRNVVADLLLDAPESGAGRMGSMANGAVGVGDDVTADDIYEVMLDSYRSFVTLPSARRATAEVLNHLAEESAGPSLLHCTAGKDRTGWLTALILTILDVDRDEILADYLASGPVVAKLIAGYLQAATESGHDVTRFAPAFTVEEAYLEAAWETMAATFGSLDDYLSAGLGLPADFPTRLRARLLET
ncbi:MAG: tyrosine-protein phosphatase [Actinobacteria bacterium]|nr:tyrosine-protein phosphatase [Actinomycetota bacterium]